MVDTTSNTTQPRLHCTKCGAVELAGSGVTLTTCGAHHKDSAKLQAECTTAAYCSAACRNDHVAVHRRVCGRATLYCPDNIFSGMRPFAAQVSWSGMDEAPYALSANGGQKLACPSTELIGVPILLKIADDSHSGHEPKPMTVGDLLMINPDTGYPPQISDTWKANPFKHYHLEIQRQDGKPLTAETLETILEFLSAIVQDMSSKSPLRGWLPLREYFTPAAFQHFSHRYFKEQREKGRDGFDGPFAPL